MARFGVTDHFKMAGDTVMFDKPLWRWLWPAMSVCRNTAGMTSCEYRPAPSTVTGYDARRRVVSDGADALNGTGSLFPLLS